MIRVAPVDQVTRLTILYSKAYNIVNNGPTLYIRSDTLRKHLLNFVYRKISQLPKFPHLCLFSERN